MIFDDSAAIHLPLEIAGVQFDVRVRGANPERVEHRFGAYRAASIGRPIRVGIDVSSEYGAIRFQQPVEVEFPGFHVVRETPDVYRFRRLGGEIVFDRNAGVATCRFDVSNPRIDASQDATAVDPATRALLTLLLPGHDGFMLHAAGWADERGAVLFAGPTEAGKTTCSRKLPGAGILSDDQVAVRREGGEWFAYATPFVGEYAKPTRPRRALLRRVFLIAKAPGDARIRSLPKPEALLQVMRCVAWNATGDPGAAQAFESISDLVKTGRVEHLEVSKDAPLDGIVAAALESV